MIKSMHCKSETEVTDLLNKFKKNGWKLTDYFINIVFTGFEYVVFYDEMFEWD